MLILFLGLPSCFPGNHGRFIGDVEKILTSEEEESEYTG